MSLLIQELNLNNSQDVDFIVHRHLEIQKQWKKDYFLTQDDVINEKNKLLENKNNCLNLVILFQNQIIAFHRIIKKLEHQTVIAQIVSSWVDPEFRGRGLLFELKKISLEWSIQSGAQVVRSRVHKTNTRMLNLNIKMDYQIVELGDFILLEKKIKKEKI